ncbi:MAG: hypothetical protein U1F23_13420 [Lysobacterales bacterium]
MAVANSRSRSSPTAPVARFGTPCRQLLVGVARACRRHPVRDLENGRLWSASGQGARCRPCAGRVRTRHRALRAGPRGCEAAVLECAVLRDPPAPVRHLTLSNAGTRPRRFELASAVELVIGPDGADAAHPAFSKMFVETEAIDGGRMLLACRRRAAATRSRSARCMGAASTRHARRRWPETDRALLLGRCRPLADPRLFDEGVPLAGSAGIVLDPVFCPRRRRTLAPGATLQATSLDAAGRRARCAMRCARFGAGA